MDNILKIDYTDSINFCFLLSIYLILYFYNIKNIDVDVYSIEIHKNDGFVFFDYASGDPYIKINLNNKLSYKYWKKLNLNNKLFKEDIDKYCYKDGIFFFTS